MPKNISKHKENKFSSTLPVSRPRKILEKLPVDDKILDKSITFSFIFLDRHHKFFNLGGKAKDNTCRR